jgi:hypothetical protein
MRLHLSCARQAALDAAHPTTTVTNMQLASPHTRQNAHAPTHGRTPTSAQQTHGQRRLSPVATSAGFTSLYVGCKTHRGRTEAQAQSWPGRKVGAGAGLQVSSATKASRHICHTGAVLKLPLLVVLLVAVLTSTIELRQASPGLGHPAPTWGGSARHNQHTGQHAGACT